MIGTDAVLELVYAPVALTDRPAAAAALARIRTTEPDPVLRQVLGSSASRLTGRALLLGAAAARLDPPLEWGAVVAAVAATTTPSAESTDDGHAAQDAVVAGSAVARAVARALGPAHTAAGWWVETTAGVVGAAAATARLFGLRDATLRYAIGIAATQASGLHSLAGTALGAVQLGHASATGLEAALLAGNGFTASEDPLAGRRGMYALMSASGRAETVVR